jgi:hypothetical protein
MEVFAARLSENGNEAGAKLFGLGRCPHCTVATPNMNKVWSDKVREVDRPIWAAYRCSTCTGVVLTLGHLGYDRFEVSRLFPDAKTAHEDIPEPGRTFLQQAYDTLHAPDASAVMAGSAVDAMLKHHGFAEGSLYKRIDEALGANILTQSMADWAHEVRLGSNRPRHADKDKPHVSEEEAKQSVEFAEALGNFLFVLTARIKRGIDAAKATEGS